MYMTREEIREAVRQGQAVLGLELGSTRIKAVLIGPDHAPLPQALSIGRTAWRTGCGLTP